MLDYRKLLETSRSLRAAVLLALLAWMWLPPFHGQVIGPQRRSVRAWTMYSSVGRGLRDVRFFDARRGEMQRIDWPSLPPQPDERLEAGPHRRIIDGDEDFEWVVGELCRQLGPEADLRAMVRTATRSGWRPQLSGERNLCDGAPNAR